MNTQLPKVGDRITVTTRFPSAGFAPWVRRDCVTNGQVLASKHWDYPGSFRMTTGRPEFPECLVPIEYIIRIEYQSGRVEAAPKFAAPTPKTWSIKGSKPGSQYTVTRGVSGNMSCTCAGFSFRRNCRHLKEVV